MAVITISRQIGSLEWQVANGVAQHLGYRLVSREVINQAALRGGTPEVALSVIDEFHLMAVTPSTDAFQTYLGAVKSVMVELADIGDVVIVGRAGQVILSGRDDTLHVRLVATVEVRVQRLVEEQHISLEAAQAQVETSDRNRKDYLKRYYHVNWDEGCLYDLIINTGYLLPEAAVGLVCQALSYKMHPLTKTTEIL